MRIHMFDPHYLIQDERSQVREEKDLCLVDSTMPCLTSTMATMTTTEEQGDEVDKITMRI
jgi:hypothetical protein